MNNSEIKKTPLYSEHAKMGAKIVEFAGFYMPLYYKSIIEEHLNVRKNSGIFDISHMGEITIKGKDASSFVDYVFTADVSKIGSGEIVYSLILNEKGGIIDDVTVFKFSDDEYTAVVNASNTQKDFAWIRHVQNEFQKKGKDVAVQNISDEIGLLSVQGPKSRDLIYPLISEVVKIGKCGLFDFKFQPKNIKDLKHFEFGCAIFKDVNVEAMISRSGYTGEFGFEIFIPAEKTVVLWNYLLQNSNLSNLLPVGLGARDTLRFEAALPLYGHELDETINPYDAGLEKYLSDAKDFIGKEALKNIKNKEKRLIFFKLSGKQIPRHSQRILDENLKPIGCIASGTYSPSNKFPIGSAYISDAGVNLSYLKNFFIDIRGNFEKAEVVSPPFHKNLKTGNSK
ncbi:MAG: glycine cleavage system aminomethyltransferase GcvT [Candidatus Acidulodesulfobacterium acidiphilum]|uniref:aminomethyltransferase n=1 Tax=Candidatus Acidulodesulfobacterium acidiphilum TaxID=2597224 RepID=A0A520XC88_9DELT|nr:MAG: glycine cleavage system aminomethyltransferase GcvT [Candidatus Acidulodesulfobacterium acidiphilum]